MSVYNNPGGVPNQVFYNIWSLVTAQSFQMQSNFPPTHLLAKEVEVTLPVVVSWVVVGSTRHVAIVAFETGQDLTSPNRARKRQLKRLVLIGRLIE